METIISACISAAVTLVVCVISNNAQQEKTRTLMEYKLEELTKRVNEHNNLIKRTYALEEKMSVHEEQIKVANHRIEGDIEKGRMIMEQIANYVKPELIVVAIALYFIGMALKQAQAVKDKYIPLILGGVSIVICAIYVFAICTCNSGQDIAMAIFTAVTQGILIAGLSTYVNQIVKQTNKDE